MEITEMHDQFVNNLPLKTMYLEYHFINLSDACAF